MALFPAALIAFIFTSSMITLTVYFGAYAFMNPDKEAWCGIGKDNNYILHTGDLDLDYNVDIHSRFVGWFKAGFFLLAISPYMAVLICSLATCISPTLGFICKQSLCYILGMCL